MKNSTRFLNNTLILAVTCFFQFANAQIVYTDISPKVTLSAKTNSGVDSSSYNLDVNNDGTIDFTIAAFASSLPPPGCHFEQCGFHNIRASVIVYPLSNAVAENSTSDSLALSINGEVDSTRLFSNQTSLTLLADKGAYTSLAYYSGLWSQSTDEYLGLRLTVGGKNYYGWTRLSITFSVPSNNKPKATFTLEDYAYNTIPDQSILAGQTCPPQSIIVPNGPTTFCSSDSVILSSANTGNNLSYKWKLNGNNITGATNKSYTAKIAGKFKLTVKDNTNNCSATSAVVKVNGPCKVLNEEIEEHEIVELSAYPNPLSNVTTISFFLPETEKISLKIFDMEERLIRTIVNGILSEGALTLVWDARDEKGNEVSEGIYLLQLSSPKNSQTIQLSVIK